MSALWVWFAVEDALETVNNSLVVDKDMDGTLCAGSQMDDGQGLGDLGVLGQAVNPRAVVHAVAYTVVNSVSHPSQ